MVCSQCGVCCRLFVINLSEKEYNSGKFKTMFDEFVPDWKEAVLVGANLLSQNDDGSCVYLKDNKCSIHDSRPLSCKNFFCFSENPKFFNMLEKIRLYKDGCV